MQLDGLRIGALAVQPRMILGSRDTMPINLDFIKSPVRSPFSLKSSLYSRELDLGLRKDSGLGKVRFEHGLARIQIVTQRGRA
jgi:hypothetical protein